MVSIMPALVWYSFWQWSAHVPGLVASRCTAVVLDGGTRRVSFVVPPESWRTSLCGFGQRSRLAGLVVDGAHHVCRAVSTVVVVEPVAPVQDDGLCLAGVAELVA